ncbi:MAG: tetratricopeptide repeat protein [bacterium]
MRPVHWIETELSRHFEDLDLTRGADLDRNGKIEGSERTDQNSDGEVDSAEWQKFTGDNKAALEKLGGHFKTYYSAGTAFKPDNPIHDLISIESELVSPEDVKKAYGKAEEILHIVQEYLASEELPKKKLILPYGGMERVGIEFKNQSDSGFINNINRNVLDCDTSSFVALAIAHELNWPVFLVPAPDHIFVRWDDGKEDRYNMDGGLSVDDPVYSVVYNISQDALDQGVYMQNMKPDDILSLFYSNRAAVKSDRGMYEDALKDNDKAIELNPNSAIDYNNRGDAKFRLKRYKEALADFEKALKLDPNFAEAYYNRANTERKLGKYKEAIKDRQRALELNPSLSCLCDTVGSTGSASPSNPSLLSLLLTVIFD